MGWITTLHVHAAFIFDLCAADSDRSFLHSTLTGSLASCVVPVALQSRLASTSDATAHIERLHMKQKLHQSSC